MRTLRLNGVSLLLVALVGVLSANCGLLDGSSKPDAGQTGIGGAGGNACAYGGASYGKPGCLDAGSGAGGSNACAYGGASYGKPGCVDAAVATCSGVLFDNGNTAACTSPTNTSVFTLTSASTVTSLRLWTNTTLSGQTVTYTLLGPTGTTLSSGATTKGGCDPYQTNWCEFLVSINVTLAAGTYTVKSSAAATCANSGSNNVGFVLVKGCAGAAPLPDAGVIDAAVNTCSGVLFDNGNTAACTSPTNTSVFSLASVSTVTYLRLWTNTTLSGQTVTYTLLGPTGTTLSSGPTTKGGCDPYQTNWCEFLVSMNMTLAAGTYTVKSSATATCANSGSNNVGMVTVKGCAAAAPTADAGACPFGGAGYGQPGCGDAGVATCSGVLFDNGNTAACTSPTNTSVFTLASASTVTSLRLWTNTTISGQTVTYTLLGPTGTTLSTGPTTKGGCDPYQTNWCEFLVTMNMALPAGTYTVKSSATATCANSGSNNVGFVLVKGCGGSSLPDAGAGANACNLIVNGNAEAALGAVNGTPVVTPGWTALGQATAAQYGVDGWPALSDPGPTDRGLNLFSGGSSDATSSLTQTISVSQSASAIDTGGVTYLLSGWLGGYAGQDDNAPLTVTFQNTSGLALGSGTIGPVMASERSGATAFLLRSSNGIVPAGTRSVLVVLSLVRTSGTANDGYADNLSLVLSGAGITACTGSQADGGVADAGPAYFAVSTPPTAMTAPTGAKVSALKTTTNLSIGGIFWKDGRLYVPSSVGGPIVHVMPGETGTLWTTVTSLSGGNPSWRHGVPLSGGNILLAIDYYGGPTGLHEITPTGTDTAWTLAQGHAGIGDLVALPSGGWVFSDFESTNLWKVSAKNAAETAVIAAGAPYYYPAYLAHDATTDTLYFVNMNNLGSEPYFAGDGSIYKLTTGAPTLVATAPASNRFSGLAIGLGGLFPAGLYAVDPANSRVVRVESTGTLTPVVTGIPTPNEIRIDPISKGMALLSADQIIFILP